MKKTTIKDIAKYLSVSTSTVSRALSGHADLSDAMKAKVLEVAELLNYAPNLRAKYLRTNRSGLVALILPEINMFFTPSLIDGINHVVEQRDYSLIILQSDNSFQKEKELIRYCVSNSIEGVLLPLSEETKNLDHLKILLDDDKPVVLLDKAIDQSNVPSISLDETAAGYQAITYLLSRGHKNIVGVFGNPNLRMTKMRRTGFKKAFAEYNLPVGEHQIIEVENIGCFEEAFSKSLMNYPEATAFFTMSDELMVHTYHGLLKRGMRIPNDMALISISDGKAPYFLAPNITHLEHSGYQVGENAIRLLFEMMSASGNKQARKIKYQTCLVELQSV